jgi:hypothetical protein
VIRIADSPRLEFPIQLSNSREEIPLFVMAGLRPGHPRFLARLSCVTEDKTCKKTWMAGTRPGMKNSKISGSIFKRPFTASHSRGAFRPSCANRFAQVRAWGMPGARAPAAARVV